MSTTIKGKFGGTNSETITANAAGNSTTMLYITGPAQDKTLYGGKVAGRYIKETTTTHRWIEDFQINAAATPPTTYTADSI
jgi:hypothetical protein